MISKRLVKYWKFNSKTGTTKTNCKSAKTMAFFIEEARECQTKTIFYLELSNDKTARAAAEAIGASTHELHSGHNVTKEDFEKGVTYVDLLDRNYHALREAF